MPSDTLAHVHLTTDTVATLEATPPHPPRVETPEYRKAHSFLINRKNAPCHICGVTKRTLKNPAKNPMGATQMETHHWPVERSLTDACDWRKIHRDYPSVYDQASFERWVDSPENLLVLCDIHHRSPEAGIHHLLTQDWMVLKYLLDGYRVVATAKDAAAVLATDEKIESSAA